MSAPAWEAVEPRPDFKRETRYGRPLIVPEGGGKAVPYTRATTLVGAAEDTWNLSRWAQRMTALGLVEREDLRLAVAAHRDDKSALDRICEDAKEHAGGSSGATKGTAFHSLTDLIDAGRSLPKGLDRDVVASLEAYRDAMAGIEVLAIEQQLVNDPLKAAGTADRLLRIGGKVYIGDLKTGSIELGIQKIAGQLALYSRSRPYDVTTDTRGDYHGASTERGLIVHLPATDPGVCRLVWVDLVAGWEWVKLCVEVRRQRGLRFADLTEPYAPDEPAPAPMEVKGPRPQPGPLALPDRGLFGLIDKCATREAVGDLWRAHKAIWTDALTAYAAEHIKALEDAVRRGKEALG